MKYSIFLVASLLIVGACSPKNNENTSNAEGETKKEIVENKEENNNNKNGEVAIAYVNFDSLMTNFKMAKEFRDKLNNERIKSENQLQSEGRKLEIQAQEYQMKAKNWSNFEIQQRQQELVEKEKSLMEMEERLTRKYEEMSVDFSERVNKSLMTFIENYATEQGFDFILASGQGSSVLYGKKQYNVTAEILEALNTQYTNTNKDQAK